MRLGKAVYPLKAGSLASVTGRFFNPYVTPGLVIYSCSSNYLNSTSFLVLLRIELHSLTLSSSLSISLFKILKVLARSRFTWQHLCRCHSLLTSNRRIKANVLARFQVRICSRDDLDFTKVRRTEFPSLSAFHVALIELSHNSIYLISNDSNSLGDQHRLYLYRVSR